MPILKSDGVLAVFSGNLKNSFSEIFQDLMLWKSQQVFSSAYKDVQRFIWNLESENSAKKMVLHVNQKRQTLLLTESCKKKV